MTPIDWQSVWLAWTNRAALSHFLVRLWWRGMSQPRPLSQQPVRLRRLNGHE